MSTAGATIEAGEIALADDQSVWIQFTTPYAIPLELETIITSGTSSVFVVEVYTNFQNAIEDIVQVTGNSDISQPLNFTSTRNTSYAIRFASSEDVDFNLYIRPTGIFDSYVSDNTYETYTFNLTNAPLRFGGDNFDAGAEGNEPSLDGFDDNTVWAKLGYYNDEPGVLIIDTFGSDFDTVLHVFEGIGAPSTLNLLALNDDLTGSTLSRVTLSITPNTQVSVRVTGFGPAATGNVVLNADFKPAGQDTALAALKDSLDLDVCFSQVLGTNIELPWVAFGEYAYRVQFSSTTSSWVTIEDVVPSEAYDPAYTYAFSLPGAGPHYVRVEFLGEP
jgi:hypothetical protein|tara:strand:- start:1703 stop:2701 length:999 start_codon:yes stop_codon:yes gene_type:complete